MNQCIRLVESLVNFAKKRPIEEVKIATKGVISVLGNLNTVRFIYLSGNGFHFEIKLCLLNRNRFK